MVIIIWILLPYARHYAKDFQCRFLVFPITWWDVNFIFWKFMFYSWENGISERGSHQISHLPTGRHGELSPGLSGLNNHCATRQPLCRGDPGVLVCGQGSWPQRLIGTQRFYVLDVCLFALWKGRIKVILKQGHPEISPSASDWEGLVRDLGDLVFTAWWSTLTYRLECL